MVGVEGNERNYRIECELTIKQREFVNEQMA